MDGTGFFFSIFLMQITEKTASKIKCFGQFGPQNESKMNRKWTKNEVKKGQNKTFFFLIDAN